MAKIGCKLACMNKTPIVARFFAISLLCVSVAAHAEALTEADVIRLAKTRDPDVAAARQEVALAQAARLEAGLFQNPSIAWDRESFSFGASATDRGETEDAFLLTAPLDLSSRRSSRRHLAQAQIAFARAEASRRQSAAVVRALKLMLLLVAEKAQVKLQEGAVERLADAASIVNQRQAVGSISGFDQLRIVIESELAASALRQSQARLHRFQTRLAILLGVSETDTTFALSLGVDEALARSVDSSRTTASGAKPQPSLDFFRSAQAASESAVQVAKWTWIPSFSLSAGAKTANADQTKMAYLAGLSMELPLFSRGQEIRAKAEAESRLAEARNKAAIRLAAIQVADASQSFDASRKELRLFDAGTNGRSIRLERAAKSAYQEGERTITALIDARRLVLEVQTKRLALLLSVMRAEIELRAARGEFE